MIPTKEQAKKLWEKYQLPEYKRRHVELVARTARFLAQQINKLTNSPIDQSLLRAGALLHDIDKNIPKSPAEQHPDTGVRVLKGEGMDEVARLVKTHSLHAILDPTVCPKTWEEKILFLSDKMVKQEIITVDERFNLWRAEDLPADAVKILDQAYPRVKQLEKEIFSLIGVDPAAVVRLAS